MSIAGDILIVDDDQPIVDFISEALSDEGYVVRTSWDVEGARNAVAEQIPALIIMDLHMPSRTGDQFVRDLRRDGYKDLPVILMTADTLSARALEAEGVAFCLLKPLGLDELPVAVANHKRSAFTKRSFSCSRTCK